MATGPEMSLDRRTFVGLNIAAVHKASEDILSQYPTVEIVPAGR